MGYDPIKAIDVPATYALVDTYSRQATLLEV